MEHQPISRWRVAGAITTAILSTLVAIGVQGCWQADRQLRDAARAEPVRAAVDLSQVGAVEAPFDQTYSLSHAEVIMLHVDGASKAWEGLLTGFKGRMEIVDGEGLPVFETDLHELDRFVAPEDDDLVVADLTPFAVGRYTFRLYVDEPAPALAGKSQTIIAQYWLCGCEMLGAMGFGILIVAFGPPTLVVGLATAVGLLRYGWRQRPPKAAATTDEISPPAETSA